MTCIPVKLPGGQRAIVCTQTRRCKCGRPAKLLCDWKTPGAKKPTCDAPVCERCTTKPAPDKDLCVKHAIAYQEWKARRP